MNMNKLTVNDVNFNNKSVFIRCDYNVPMKDGKITNTARIDASIPTL